MAFSLFSKHCNSVQLISFLKPCLSLRLYVDVISKCRVIWVLMATNCIWQSSFISVDHCEAGQVWNGTHCENCSLGSFKPSAGNFAPCQTCSKGTVTPLPGASHCGKYIWNETLVQQLSGNHDVMMSWRYVIDRIQINSDSVKSTGEDHIAVLAAFLSCRGIVFRTSVRIWLEMDQAHCWYDTPS